MIPIDFVKRKRRELIEMIRFFLKFAKKLQCLFRLSKGIFSLKKQIINTVLL
jgi:hypothetical protein